MDARLQTSLSTIIAAHEAPLPVIFNTSTIIALHAPDQATTISTHPPRLQRKHSKHNHNDETMEASCCTCAKLLKDVLPEYDEKSEKPKAFDRRLDCCGRNICGNCIANNSRFATYCPFCQISTAPTSLPQGLRDPPSYTPPSSSKPSHLPPAYVDDLPSYSSSVTHTQTLPSEKSTQAQPAEDVLHFLDHEQDTLAGLSLQYGVPLETLKKANKISADNLLLARRTIVIPGEFYKAGVSLSPRPVEGEEEERKKTTVRRFMVACKVSEYDVASFYLKLVDYDLEVAVDAYKKDERWEREHPMETNVKGKGKTKHDIGRRFTGQRS